MSAHATPSKPYGFTYLAIIFFVAILSGGLALLGEVWHTTVQREKEAELLFAGQQYRKAIERYVMSVPNRNQYPRTLDDLLKDPRKQATERYLRKRYIDPITGKAEWGIIKSPDGGVMGVHSLSEEKPFKSANFRPTDKGFDNSEKYSDWKFVATFASPNPAGKPTPQPPVSR